IRMFGEIGEYHCWMGPNRTWNVRFARRDDPDWQNSVSQSYVLWGTHDLRKGEWFRLWEKRGTTVWVPHGAVPGLAANQPVVLNAKLRIAPDEDTGVIGIVDAMLCDFAIWREK